MKVMGKVRVLREMRLDASNYKAVAQALGLNPDKKPVAPSTIYIVQEAPDVDDDKT